MRTRMLPTYFLYLFLLSGWGVAGFLGAYYRNLPEQLDICIHGLRQELDNVAGCEAAYGNETDHVDETAELLDECMYDLDLQESCCHLEDTLKRVEALRKAKQK